MKNKKKRNVFIILFSLIFLKLLSKPKIDNTFLTANRIEKKINQVYKPNGVHLGIDYQAPTGTKIVFLKRGKVTTIASNCRRTNPRTTTCGGGWGNYILIKLQNGYSVRFAHLSKILVSQGEEINLPTIIGETGDTGNSTGSHLHFEYLDTNGNRINGQNVANEIFDFIK